MPPKKGVKFDSDLASSVRSRRKRGTEEEVPHVFRELLADTDHGNIENTEECTPLKRRRKTSSRASPVRGSSESRPPVPIPRKQASFSDQATHGRCEEIQMTEHGQSHRIDPSSTETSDSELEWEEVGAVSDATGGVVSPDKTVGNEDLSIRLDAVQSPSKNGASSSRRSLNAVERSVRVEIHKLHLLALLAHVHMRNSWCNDRVVQATLATLLSLRTRSYLNPSQNFSQFQKSRSFLDGLYEVSKFWRTAFTITPGGMRKASWALDELSLQQFRVSKETESPKDRTEFQEAARQLKGSHDLGAQLFCALLRSVGVQSRLVCSMQPLGFSGVGTMMALRSEKLTVNLDDDAMEIKKSTPVQVPRQLRPESRNITQPNRTMAIGMSGRDEIDAGRVVDSINRQGSETIAPGNHYPIYWVEAFNIAHQKWVAVDPISTMTVGKPSKMEPPFSNVVNNMSYVVAFESDGTAKDVTRRYAKAYNAKTRRHRVESLESGETWWRRVMSAFRRRYILDRDQVENAELSKREAEEGFPRNIQDFRGHPHYVLERHLNHNEVIFPKREVGKINAGPPASSRVESVYRRRDVHLVRTSEKWYRLGREIKTGEQPLKIHFSRRQGPLNARLAEIGPDSEESEGKAMYGYHQTEAYVPPPVIRGRVPRNGYGNIDVYVPSMIPAGAVHIRHSEAARAATLIGVDYAEAVTGFRFRDRRGTAVLEGVVVAAEYQEATTAAIEAIEAAKEEADADRRTVEALRLWRKFLTGLKVVEHVKQYGKDGYVEMAQVSEGSEGDESVREDAGGFFPGINQIEIRRPPAQNLDAEQSIGYSRRRGGEVSDTYDLHIMETNEKHLMPNVCHRSTEEPHASFSESVELEAEEGQRFIISDPDEQRQDRHGSTCETRYNHAQGRLGVGQDTRVDASGSQSSQDTHERRSQASSRCCRVSYTDEDDDRGSLLSHDPADDDADPEWLSRC